MTLRTARKKSHARRARPRSLGLNEPGKASEYDGCLDDSRRANDLEKCGTLPLEKKPELPIMTVLLQGRETKPTVSFQAAWNSFSQEEFQQIRVFETSSRPSLRDASFARRSESFPMTASSLSAKKINKKNAELNLVMSHLWGARM